MSVVSRQSETVADRQLTSILVVDVGNTQIHLGLYSAGLLTHQWRLSSRRDWSGDELAWQIHGLFVQFGLDAAAVGFVMAASVVPHLDQPVRDACLRVFGRQPLMVGLPGVEVGMTIEYTPPTDVGADRIVNAVAAKAAVGAPVIVVDCGTATTFDLVSIAGNYLGGLILPGLELGLAALCRRAAKLPEVSFGRVSGVMAQDTVNSMRAGAYWSAVESISGIIRRLHEDEQFANAPVVATGGQVAWVIADLPMINHYLPDLTLNGLYHLALLNGADRSH